jgi:DNA-binding PadR family transcriptional regulator
MTRRMTVPRLMVMAALAHVRAPMCGIELMIATDLPSGTVYPVLERLRADEMVAPVPRPRTNRIYVELTDAGRAEAARTEDWARGQMRQLEQRRRALQRLLILLPANEQLAPTG